MSGSPSTTPSLRPTRPPRGLGVGVGGRGGGDWTRGLLLGPAVVLGPVVAPPLRGPWPDATNSSEGARALSAAALTREVGALGLLVACVRASAFSALLLLCAAPSVPSAGAFLLSCRWASWCPHAACPSVATGPTRAPLPRARPPSRRPPSQGKWGPLGCSPPGVLWARWRHGSSPRLCSPCGLAHGVASSGAAHPLFGPRPPLAPPSRARLPFRRPLSQGKWRPRPRPRTCTLSPHLPRCLPASLLPPRLPPLPADVRWPPSSPRGRVFRAAGPQWRWR